MSRVAYTKRERSAITQHSFGWRPVNDWGDGDLPSPWAAGDVVMYDGTSDARRLSGFKVGPYVVCTAFSIDEGDAWYFRISDLENCSDRLHVAYAARCSDSWAEDVNWMAPMALVDTADANGLMVRARKLAEGWSL